MTGILQYPGLIIPVPDYESLHSCITCTELLCVSLFSEYMQRPKNWPKLVIDDVRDYHSSSSSEKLKILLLVCNKFSVCTGL